MFLVGILSWWYGKGWIHRIQVIRNQLGISVDFFSIKLLVSTLFSPFRQISADATGISLNDKIRAFFDRLLSRIIGFIVRVFMIIFGSIFILLQAIFGIIVLLFWLIVPFLPVIGLIMMVIGWMPL